MKRTTYIFIGLLVSGLMVIVATIIFISMSGKPYREDVNFGGDEQVTMDLNGVHVVKVFVSQDGVPEERHMLPIITSIIGWFISIFSGSVIIENTFSLNGMGKLYWAGLNNLDFELVLAIQMFYTVVALIGSLLMDVSYGLVDPRVRVDK